MVYYKKSTTLFPDVSIHCIKQDRCIHLIEPLQSQKLSNIWFSSSQKHILQIFSMSVCIFILLSQGGLTTNRLLLDITLLLSCDGSYT